MIREYKLSDQEYMMLEMIKYKTEQEIEAKFKNSHIN